MSKPDRENKLDREHPRLSIRRQCTLLSLARSGVYRERKGTSREELAVMRKIDELFLSYPFLGARRIALMLRQEGIGVNRKRVKRLMRVMGLVALGPKPRTSKPAPGHRIFPYLLKGMKIDWPRQVWAADITYIPIGRGYLYLVAIMDWASRAVLAFRLSNTMDTSFCLEALDEALARHGTPEIFNTDQGSQFTSAAFTDRLIAQGIRVSMDGRGRYLDNIFIERLWRSLKYEDVYLKGYADGREARAGIGQWIAFYNERRPHQGLAYRTPMAVFRNGPLAANGDAKGCGHVDNARALPTGPQQQQQKHDMAA
jgi:putative transposase